MRLNYIKFNQKKIRAELYNGLQNTIISGDDVSNVEQWIILYYDHVKEECSKFQRFITFMWHFIMSLYFQKEKMGGIQTFLYIIMNLPILMMKMYLNLMMKMN